MPGFTAATWLCLIILYTPLLVVTIYSFNAVRSVTVWGGFSLAWYAKAISNPNIQTATLNSIIIALLAATAATTLAMMAAMVMARGRAFRGKGFIIGLINLPLLVPEIVTAIATLIFFLSIGLSLGMVSILLAHIVFCIPFAYMPIAARLSGIEQYYDEAARDLYATRWEVFRYVILPMLLPGVLSGYMLAFIISLDDFIITNMVAGPGSTTLPLAIYGMVRTGFTPEINAISTLMLVVSMLFVTGSYLINRSGQKSGSQ